MTRLLFSLAFCVGAASWASTLEKLSLDQMVEKSTSVIRAKVVDEGAFQRGNLIYTRYRVQVTDTLKGKTTSSLDVAVPGGQLGRIRQTIAGAPKLKPGSDYLIFVWTSSTGINHIIGLSQGLFDVKLDAQGKLMVARGEIDEPMVDSQGRSVSSPALKMTLREMAERVRQGAAR